jgi:hypothetical protein
LTTADALKEDMVLGALLWGVPEGARARRSLHRGP